MIASKAILAVAIRVAITRRLAEERRIEDPRSRKEPIGPPLGDEEKIQRRNRQIEYIVVQNFSILKKQPICNIFQFRNLRFAN